MNEQKEQVNHPSHYNQGTVEVIDLIKDWRLGFNLGNAVKYIARAGQKNPDKYIEDLQKALWYLKIEATWTMKNDSYGEQLLTTILCIEYKCTPDFISRDWKLSEELSNVIFHIYWSMANTGSNKIYHLQTAYLNLDDIINTHLNIKKDS